MHLLNGLGHRARAGGNIGHPPWDPSPEPAPDYWIVETSSFQVPDLHRAPRVVGVTSLAPDHLDWHGTVERYYADKLSLCTKPGVTLALADGADDELRAQAGAPRTAPPLGDRGRGGSGRSLVALARADRAAQRAQCRAGARRPRRSRHPGRVRRRSPRRGGRGFAGLPSRCRSLGWVGAVEFVDDSLSTNVLPARAALQAYADRPVALLVGGHDRGLDYAPLGRAIAQRDAPTLVVTMPDNGPRIGRAVRAETGDRVEVVDAASLEEAVDAAVRWVPAGGVVLLSPAAPSFGRFGDYRERAAAFAAAAGRHGTLS